MFWSSIAQRDDYSKLKSTVSLKIANKDNFKYSGHKEMIDKVIDVLITLILLLYNLYIQHHTLPHKMYVILIFQLKIK